MTERAILSNSFKVLLTAMFTTFAPVQLNAADIDEIVAAAAAEEAATHKRAVLTYRVANREARYEIDRVLPNRIRILSTSGGRTSEVIAIGEKLYFRDAAGWATSTAVPLPVAPMDLADVFRQNLQDVGEIQLDASESHIKAFEGRISWLAGFRRNYESTGQIIVFIERASGRLQRLSFEGQCGDWPCHFEHVITFDPSIVIEAPR
ncbi:MAG: hypothetical protein KDK89_07085 [Alphaproteobacteria bacterium]|nr:hypothetical protein [Alphaproteobacteria bacterium]